MRPETQALLDHAAANGGEIDNIHDFPVDAVGEANALGLLDWPADDAMELAVRVKPMPSHVPEPTPAPSHVPNTAMPFLRAPSSVESLKGPMQDAVEWFAKQPLAQAVEQTIGSASPIAALRDAYRTPGGLERLSYDPGMYMGIGALKAGGAARARFRIPSAGSTRSSSR